MFDFALAELMFDVLTAKRQLLPSTSLELCVLKNTYKFYLGLFSSMAVDG